MLLGVDHLAFSATDIDQAVKTLSRWGYEPKFIARALLNAPSKKIYLAEWQDDHDIAYCQPAEPGTAIEVTAHNKQYARTQQAAFQALLCAKPDQVASTDQAGLNAGQKKLLAAAGQAYGCNVHPLFLSDYNCFVYYMDRPAETNAKSRNIKSIIVMCADLDKSQGFWELFGFRAEPKEISDADWRRLRFNSILTGRSLELLLISSGEKILAADSKLDSPGFPCLALLTSNLAAEIERLAAKGIKGSGEFALAVGDKDLKICLFSGLNGEMIELIQVADRR